MLGFILLTVIWVCAAVCDLTTRRIPNILTLMLAGLALTYRYLQSNWAGLISPLLVTAALAVIFLLFRYLGKNWLLGGGDIKMLIASSVWLDPGNIPLFLVITGAFGVLLALIYRSKVFPFAPAIGGGLILTLTIANFSVLDYTPSLACAKSADRTDINFVSKRGDMKKEDKFNCLYIKAKSQPPKKIIIVMHGYGADADNIAPVAQAMADAIDDADVFVPDGFDPCEENPTGYQWFRSKDWGDLEELKIGINEAAKKMNAKIDALLKEYKLDDSNLYLVGFSQGAMMALHIGLQRKVAGIIGFSGILLDESVVGGENTAGTSVLLLHDSQDMVVPVSFCTKAENCLKRANISVKAIISQGFGHSITQTALRTACDFLKNSHRL
ncbi:MAG: prepilin peptidase [Holosporales bacterium]|nr:prepilin peptidase [Holosporales bacterium]